MAWAWRLVVGWLLVGTVRRGVRWVPWCLAHALAAAVWPSVLVALALRRRAVPWAGSRWPRLGRSVPAVLAAAGAVAVVAVVALPAPQRDGLRVLYTAGWLAPAAVPAGILAPALGAQAVALALPLWLAGGVVLAGLWPAYGPLWRRMARSPAAKPDGRTPAGDRASGIGGHQERGPVDVQLRPVPTQRIATATFGEDAWTVKPLYGPGLLCMIVAPPGVGKTELVYGSLAAAFDGLPFCGLETAKPRRVLLLSEMEPKTIQPALRRWGFVAEDAPDGLRGVVTRLRYRYTRPDGSAGHLIDVVHASDAYTPDAEGRRPAWADVIRATVPLIARGGYDLLLVDSLARWMGNDSSNAVMLDALAALRQVTRLGVGVVAPHHCAKDASPPYAPRGGSAILGELDICWSLAHPDGRVTVEALRDPRRVLECVKSRFSEDTPPPLRIARVERDPDAPRSRYGYVLAAPASPAGSVVPDTETAEDRYARDLAGLTDNQRRVLVTLADAPGHRATTPELAASAGIEAKRVQEAAVALIERSLARPAGEGSAPKRGGRRPVVYAATPHGLAVASVVKVPPRAAEAEAPTGSPADRLLREALPAEPGREGA